MAYDLGTIFASISLNTAKLDAGLAKAQVQLSQADKSISTMGQKLTLASTKMMVAGGIMAGAVAAVGVASIKTAKEFDTSMRNVNSIAKLSEQEFQNLSKDVVDLSKKLPQSAKTLADGLYDISSSGFAGAEGMKVLEAAAKAASAGMTDTATSAKGITAVLNAYGLEAEDAAEVSDTMFTTVDKGVISFEELSGGIGNVLSTANLASIEFNELSGMIAYMTTKGVSADETMTALNRLILNIIKPSEDLAEVLHNAGYESGEAAIKAEGLTGVLALMETASGGSLTKLQELSPEMRALKASGALLGGGIEELTGYMENFKDTTGATQAALDEQSKSLDYQLDLLKNNIDAIKITLGSELVPEIAKTTGALSDWISKNDDLAVILTKLVGGAVGGGGLLLLFAWALEKIRALFITMGTGGAIGFGVIGFLINLASAIYGLYDTIQKFREGTANWEDDWYRLAYPMIPVLEKLLGIEKETKNASQSFEHLTGYLTAAKTAMHQGRVATNDLAEAERILAETTEEAAKSTEELFDEIFGLYNLEQSVTEASWKFEDSIKNLIEVQKDATSTERDKKAAVFETEDAYEEYINEFGEAYEAEETNIWQKERTKQSFVEATLTALEYGTITKEQAEKAAAAFGLSADDIILMAGDMGLKLDEATQERYIEIKHNMKEVESDVDKLYKKLSDIDGMNVTFKMVQTGLMGWASGGIIGYKEGGIMPKAAGGMVVPQTGRAIPILAHEGEMILNSSQQGNLINALWGVANGKDSGGSINNNFYISELVVREEADVNRIADELYSIQRSKQIGVGVR